MTCQCEIIRLKLEALEKLINAEGWAFVSRDRAIRVVKMIRDECRHQDSDKTDYCHNATCAAGCKVWEGKT